MRSQGRTKAKVRRGRPAKEGLREHLLVHTLRVLLRDGYENFSMNAVAVSASASKESLYKIFRDKAGLLGAALDHLGKMVEPLLLAGVGDDLGREPRLRRLAENYLRGCLLPESLTLQRIAYASGEKALGQVFAKEFTDAALAVMTRQMGAIGTPEPELDAEIFLAMVQGQVHEKVLLGVESPQARKRHKEVAAHAVRIFTAYLKEND
jgi:AcrR family transcriptional regulator